MLLYHLLWLAAIVKISQAQLPRGSYRPPTITVATMDIRLLGGSAHVQDSEASLEAPTEHPTIIVATMDIRHLQGSAHGIGAWTMIVAMQNIKHHQC